MATIGVFDSGAGGLSVLKEIRKALPEERYVYFSDNANCPYGDKSPEFIRTRCHAIADSLIADGAGVIVVACNTATAAAISDLRASYDIPFIGMEPAVKPAALGTRSGVVGVLATAGTLKGSKYLDTKGHIPDSVKVVEHVGRGFVELVESLELDGPHAEKVVRDSVEPLLQAGADTIVLGCTHYPFLMDLIRKVAGPDVKVIDPAPAVCRRLVDVMKENGIPATDPEPQVILKASGSDSTVKKLYEKII